MPDAAARRHAGDREDDYRSPTSRDVDRILYSSAFRRLSGVTQVVSADETLLFHNRLTHSLKVAQVARRAAERLCKEFSAEVARGPGLDPTAAEAAALAHDLGHPPFGHIAEEVLHECCTNEEYDINGFEGNAQTFRIVTKLSWRTDKPGLNLTRRTLRGVLKYPWLREGDSASKRKWGAYETERADFAWAWEDNAPRKSVEAQIMDWADDITYAVHDLEDFYRAGLTPLDRLQNDQFERQRFATRASASLSRYSEFDPDKAIEALDSALTLVALTRPYRGTVKDRILLHQTSSNLITRFLGNTGLSSDGTQLQIPPSIWHEVNMLKQLTWHYVINSPDLATLQEGQKRVVADLFGYLVEWGAREKQRDRLPTRFRETIAQLAEDYDAQEFLEGSNSRLMARAAADYISSLTEAQAVELHGRFLGVSRSSVLNAWVRV